MNLGEMNVKKRGIGCQWMVHLTLISFIARGNCEASHGWAALWAPAVVLSLGIHANQIRQAARSLPVRSHPWFGILNFPLVGIAKDVFVRLCNLVGSYLADSPTTSITTQSRISTCIDRFARRTTHSSRFTPAFAVDVGGLRGEDVTVPRSLYFCPARGAVRLESTRALTYARKTNSTTHRRG